MRRRTLSLLFLAAMLITWSCDRGSTAATADEEQENREAKAMLQGFWMNSDDEEVAFRVEGDTIFYPDETSLPAYFRILGDTLYLGAYAYPIERQSQQLFWFRNQYGDRVRLERTGDSLFVEDFERPAAESKPVTEVIKTDSVVFLDGTRYHWYIAVNPTKYKVMKTVYNADGVGVENVYYDNIIHLSIYQGAECLFSSDFRKQQFTENVPQAFLSQAVLASMTFSHSDRQGMHFDVSLCIPDEPRCYVFDAVVNTSGKLHITPQNT